MSDLLKNLIAAFGARTQRDEHVVHDDLLSLPDEEQIEFTSLRPSDVSILAVGLGRLTSEILEPALDPLCRDSGMTLLRQYEVAVMSSRFGLLEGTVKCDPPVQVSVELVNNSAAARCSSCGDLSNGGELFFRNVCHHSAALLLTVCSLNAEAGREAFDSHAVCPVTRSRLSAMDPLYRCGRCASLYSMQGWDFLSTMDKGKCCCCGARGTIQPVHSGPVDGDSGR